MGISHIDWKMYHHIIILVVAAIFFSISKSVPNPQFRRWGQINGGFYPSNGGNGGYFPGNNGGFFPSNGGNGGYFPGNNGGNGGYFPGNNGGYYPGSSSGTGRRPYYYGGGYRYGRFGKWSQRSYNFVGILFDVKNLFSFDVINLN